MNLNFKIPKIKKKFKKGGIHINPEIYWIITLGIFSVIIIIFIIIGYLLFKKVNSEVSAEDNGMKIESIDQERINKALEYFKNREEVSQEIINFPSSVVDPSR